MSDQNLTQDEIDLLLREWEEYLGFEREKPEKKSKDKKVPELPKCDCEIRLLMLKGCQCGGV